jgi:DNA replication and repair protein RecF
MFLQQLALHNFRNYARLALDLPPGPLFVVGENAQGKSNLLESVFFLATTRSPRTANDRELVNWRALAEEMPFARAAGVVVRESGKTRLDVTMMLKEGAPPAGREDGGRLTLGKRITVNGVPKRAMDLLGQLEVVMFSPHDIELVNGSPSARRRYLDITNSMVDHRYVRALQRFNRVLLQRNSLLRAIRERQARRDQLDYWDDLLIENGAYITQRRQDSLRALNRGLREIHPELTGKEERLDIAYLPSIYQNGHRVDLLRESGPESERELADSYRGALSREHRREVAAGVSLLGPHRDDLRFVVNGVDMTTFGSRGQQRTAALSLKLAEAQYMQEETAEPPLLLLDDVMSELDGARRRHISAWLRRDRQAIIVATDLDQYRPELVQDATMLRVVNGSLKPA